MRRYVLFVVLGVSVAWSAAAKPSVDLAATPAASLAQPEDLQALREIERRVQSVARDHTGATVCLMIGGATGSGVIVSKGGLILTAAHVSGRPGRDVTVIFPDGSQASGKTLGHNAREDAGMVEITDAAPQGGWPHVGLADDDSLEQAHWVIAMGHPGGFDAQRPIVARLGQVEGINWNGVVTDCTIIGGDSGGPLFDLDGKLVAIHSRIGLSTEQNMHVPIAVYREGWDRMAAGEVWNQWVMPAANPDAPFLGVAGRNHKRGVEILSIVKGSAADKAGLKVNDVITAIDGRPIEDYAQLVDRIADLKVGHNAQIVVIRDREPKTLHALIQRRGG